MCIHVDTLQHNATYCNTLQHAASHCVTLQHTAKHCDTLQNTGTHLKPIAICASFFAIGEICKKREVRGKKEKNEFMHRLLFSW